MSLPRLPAHLTRRDAVALILILTGLAGMVRHFSAKPEPAASASPRATATTFTAPAIPRFSSTPDASRPSEAVQAMRRRLREFVIPLPNIKSLPAPNALALLQHFWQTLPHETDAIPPATFTLSESAAPQLAASQPPILVSLEIPGISVLTHLQLLAAQTELQLRVTESGTILELPANRPNSRIQTTLAPLDIATMNRFTSRSLRILHDQADTFDDSARRENFLTDPRGVGISVQLMRKSATRVTQPVFATRMLEPQQKQALARLFASMEIPEQQQPTDSNSQPHTNGHIWMAEENTLTTTGPQRTQRIAGETAAAI